MKRGTDLARALVRACVGEEHYPGLGRGLRSRLEPLFEGIGTSGKRNCRQELLEAAGRLAMNLRITHRLERRQRLTALKAPDIVMNGEDDLITKTLAKTAIILRKYKRSSNPRQYLQFLSRRWGANQCEAFFFDISRLYTIERRKVSLTDISPERIAVGDELVRLINGEEKRVDGKIRELLGNDESLEEGELKCVQKAVRSLRSKRNGLDSRMETDDANQELRRFGIFRAEGRLWRFHRVYERGDIGIMLSSRPEDIPEGRTGVSDRHMSTTLLASESEPAIQYGLQLGFDYYLGMPKTWRETVFRAKCASLVFSPMARGEGMANERQRKMVSDKMNWEYERMFGLTYDGILEPLHKA